MRGKHRNRILTCPAEWSKSHEADVSERLDRKFNIAYPNVHQISKHMTFSQKKLARKEKWMTNAETESSTYYQRQGHRTNTREHIEGLNRKWFARQQPRLRVSVARHLGFLSSLRMWLRAREEERNFNCAGHAFVKNEVNQWFCIKNKKKPYSDPRHF